ncbi:MAG TPA: Do family serine endopeptidase [Spirochaetales bacterium]|nr:Do family serine endopeptidase [Spirochaetales bacterium]
MSLQKVLYSRKFFIINVVILGILIGLLSGFFIFGAGTLKAKTTAQSFPQSNSVTKTVPFTEQDTRSLSYAESLQNAFNEVAQHVIPSIVELRITAEAQTQIPTLPFPFFENIPKSAPEEVEGLGSGIIVRQDGKSVYVLTNNHVVDGAKTVLVKLWDDSEYTGKILGVDKRRDLAVVQFESQNPVSVATLGNSDEIKVGDWAIAIGSPLGLSQSVTVGIVSAVNRNGGPDDNINDFIQTDAAINRGNSGGALVNIRGEVIGINTWIASPNGGNIGLGFSIPINNTKRVIETLIANGVVKYGWLGVTIQDADKELATAMGLLTQKGAFIGNIFVGSPAQKAGLLPGDFIVEIDSKPVTSADQVMRIVGEMEAGKRYTFTVLRQNKRLSFSAQIAERKELKSDDYANLWPGFSVVAINDKIRDTLNLSKNQTGVVIASIQKDSPAEILQLKEGDVIIKINDKQVASLADFYSILNSPDAKKIHFTILRNKQELTTLSFVRKF